MLLGHSLATRGNWILRNRNAGLTALALIWRKRAERRTYRGLASHDDPNSGFDETLVAPGADVRWAFKIFETDHAAAAIAAANILFCDQRSLKTLGLLITFMLAPKCWTIAAMRIVLFFGARAEAGEDIIPVPQSEEEAVIGRRLRDGTIASWLQNPRVIKAVRGKQRCSPFYEGKWPATVPCDQRE